MSDRQYGISTASLFPVSYGPDGFRRAINLALDLGFNGIQGLPLRGWRYDNKALEPYLISYEDAWNHGSFFAMLGRQLGQNTGPTLKDWILFGQQGFPIYLESIYSIHDFLEDPIACVGPIVTEISPELSIYAADYLAYVEKGGNFCWDTMHARRTSRGSFDLRINWRRLLAVLPNESIGLIHVQPKDDQEARVFLSGHDCELTDMLWTLRTRISFNTPIILELYPELKPWKWSKYQTDLKLWLKLLKEILD